MLDFNRANISSTDINRMINEVLDKAFLEAEREARRSYLGASGIGSECLRKVQFDWQLDSKHPARIQRIFDRGHAFEEITVRAFARAGIRMERGTPKTEFTALEGLFRGHADGIILDGRSLFQVPCLWEHKALGARGWSKLEKDGLQKAYPQYYDQCQLYMAYLGLDENPALFTAVNADNCEILHLQVPFDAEAAQAASDRAVLVIKATKAGELLPRIAREPSNWHCKMCSHSEECWRVE